MFANKWVLVIIDWTILPHVLHFFTPQDVEPTNPWLRLGGEWICKAGRNHQRSSMVGTFSKKNLLFHITFLSFDTIQVNCLNTWYFFFSIFTPSSFCCSFFWNSPSRLPQYSVLFIGPRSDHSLRMSVTDWLTDSLTHWLTNDLVEDEWMNWPLLMESNI